MRGLLVNHRLVIAERGMNREERGENDDRKSADHYGDRKHDYPQRVFHPAIIANLKIWP